MSRCAVFKPAVALARVLRGDRAFAQRTSALKRQGATLSVVFSDGPATQVTAVETCRKRQGRRQNRGRRLVVRSSSSRWSVSSAGRGPRSYGWPAALAARSLLAWPPHVVAGSCATGTGNQVAPMSRPSERLKSQPLAAVKPSTPWETLEAPLDQSGRNGVSTGDSESLVEPRKRPQIS